MGRYKGAVKGVIKGDDRDRDRRGDRDVYKKELIDEYQYLFLDGITLLVKKRR